MFRAIWEFAQSRDCVAHSQNPEGMVEYYTIWYYLPIYIGKK